jgi:peptidoglycan hydrolase-like protein with peptidoglycan-binding domain
MSVDQQTWQDAVEDAVHDAAAQHGLTPDELLDVSFDDDGEPVGTGVDFMQRLDPLADADPSDPAFAQSVAGEVASYAVELHAEPEPVAAKALEYNDDLHPHKPSGPGGGQFSSTNTSSTSNARKPLTYSGVRQGTNKGGGRGGGGSASATPYKPTATLRKGGANDPAAVMQLQHMLNELGLAGINADGNFGDSTEAAVKAVQAKLGLKQTGTATLALQKALHNAHTLSPCVDKGATKVAASAGHHVPGAPYRFRHGWIPLAGAVLDDLFGAAVTMDGEDNEWVDHEEVSHYDTRELIPGLNAELFDDGTVLLTVPSPQQADHSYIVQHLASQDDANQLAEDVAWAMFRDSSDQGHRPPDPVNGLSDWKVSAGTYPGDPNGVIVGYTTDGTVRIAFPDGNTGNVIAIDLTGEEARDFQSELGQVAVTDIEGE